MSAASCGVGDPIGYGRRIAVCCIALLIAMPIVTAVAQQVPRPPEQPAAGPGGAAYAFDGVKASRHGEPPSGYWLFEPADEVDGEAAVAATPQPLVVFLHGFSALNPDAYLDWIEHVVRRGAIVVYPDYQTLELLNLRPKEYLDEAVSGVRAAIAELANPGHAPVDLTRVAAVGHSVGGVLAPSLAAVAEEAGLPKFAAVMAVQPGGCAGCGQGPEGFGVPFADLGTIPAQALVYVVVGADDEAVGDTGGRMAWEGMTNVPLANRDYVVLISDDHGRPELRADHGQPQTGLLNGETDALDWYGTWKLFDLLTACAFAGEGCDDARDGSAAQRWMGEWSDGTAVTPAEVTDSP